VPEVRLVGENVEPGVVKLSFCMADQFELDLVKFANADPPVCSYKKFVYEQKKRDKILASLK
jgi:translation initiation factor IF-3